MVPLPGNSKLVQTRYSSCDQVVLASQLASIAASIDSMRKDIAEIKAQVIRDGRNSEESVSDLKITVENSIKETPTDEEQDSLKEELKAELRIQEIGTVYNAATIILDESKICSRPNKKFLSSPAFQPSRPSGNQPSQSPPRPPPRITETEKHDRYLHVECFKDGDKYSPGHQCKVNLLESGEDALDDKPDLALVTEDDTPLMQDLLKLFLHATLVSHRLQPRSFMELLILLKFSIWLTVGPLTISSLTTFYKS
ncbi:hypothetical protein HanRHA438_Chr11g0509371 [Helianthus annuus]|nr:hypothetical protein HanHA300_Chr11g0407481 [Helianthus annuus]KAJ0517921.1 hypothetical protein HanHA89_Chr11g0431211 [Helianthus annuus]KAJ0685939.1 hypothetical protein HanLR1_Chr11g0408731 [Helianthus annuus]KAJ0689802.1 hypothetical protein HanOQP8_Chr11g0410241 [Helianthus annuus]KAJ0871193.1 hypothetical protein HanRHA438_Chr11g0509371 [Helianthus annuus]